MSNPFANWTPEMAAAHNARIASRQREINRQTIISVFERSEAKVLAAIQTAPKPKRLRQSSKGLNKLESEYFELLKREGGVFNLRSHAKTYLLANGVRYTPDFTALVHHGGCVTKETAWEVKGPHAWEDAMIKIKVAATAFPEVKWLLVWKDKGQWQCQQVLP